MSNSCPFLESSKVAYCEVAPFRKPLPCDSIDQPCQRCSSPEFVDCPLAVEHMSEAHRGAASCPFIVTAQVQHCSAAAHKTLIPLNDDLMSRCNNSSHVYCDLYLQRSKGAAPVNATTKAAACDDIQTPENLSYSANHMWMDADEDGTLHIGVDAFMARALGEIEEIRFMSEKGLKKPSVVFKVGSVELPVVFPRRIDITRVNTAALEDPSIITSDPYGAGWLFEHMPEDKTSKTDDIASLGLLSGDLSAGWMGEEVARMNEFLQEIPANDIEGEILMADGGIFCEKLCERLGCADILHMFNLFFSPHDRWKW